MSGAIPVYRSLDAVPRGAAPGVLLVPRTAGTRAASRSVAHTLLTALATRCHYRDVSIAYKPGAAPYIENMAYQRLSISYAEAWIVLACWPGRHVGIDLCATQALPEQDAVAALYFPPDQYLRLQAAQPAQRAVLFAQTWAQLEAQGKCCGQALAEWQAQHEAGRSGCATVPLNAPPGYALCMAWSALSGDREDKQTPRCRGF